MSFSPVRQETIRFDQNTYPIDHGAIKKKYASFKQGRRKAPRYAIEMEVVLFSAKKSFRTKCINASASGLLLQDFLPSDFLLQTFDIVVICHDGNEKKHISFRGVAVGGVKRSSRVVFTSSAKNAQETLFRVFSELTPIGYALDDVG